MIGALVLAAGRSRRFGSDKRLARLENGLPMLVATVNRYAAILDDVRVVLGDTDDADRLLAGTEPRKVSVVRAPDAEFGMGHSLAAGISACEGWSAALVALGDMPHVRPETLVALIARWRSSSQTTMQVLRPAFGGRPGHPVVFDASLFAALRQCSGDTGGVEIAASADARQVLETRDPGVLADVDRPDGLAPPAITCEDAIACGKSAQVAPPDSLS